MNDSEGGRAALSDASESSRDRELEGRTCKVLSSGLVVTRVLFGRGFSLTTQLISSLNFVHPSHAFLEGSKSHFRFLSRQGSHALELLRDIVIVYVGVTDEGKMKAF